MQDSTVGAGNKHKWLVFAGPLLCLFISQIPSPDPYYPTLSLMMGITAWMALWWITEAVHIAVTAFIPFIFLPATGIADIKVVSAQYMDPVLFLFIGGFLLAFAIEKWGLHRRLALSILSSSGHTASNILLGIMFTSFLISMWISNTATVMMLLSAVLAIIHQLREHLGATETHRKVSTALLIGLAYSASIGGMSTLVGTPTNMIFYRAYNEQFAAQHPIHFSDWMLMAFPMALCLLMMTWLIIRMTLLNRLGKIPFNKSIFKEQRKNLGAWNRDEKVVAVIFIATAVLWFTRADMEIGNRLFRGWAGYLPFPQQIQDSSIAIFMAMLLFFIPSSTEKNRNLLEWKEASRLPYEIILLFGSGFALAKGFETSGLSNWLALHLHGLKNVSPVYVVLVICMVVTVISEFASNVASIQLVLPILISLQSVTQSDPRIFMVPAALAASLGFMLPVATAPNTIVFSGGQIRVKEMVIAGLLVDLAGILLITLSVFFYI
ncbi:MAG: SLC13/DASS family transporter [Bacteroidia bacterium]|nr:SLC13/DASS family transporter [Bacteroidia bacterium]